MLMNNLDPDVAERPEDLVVYGGTGKAARNWECVRRDRRDARAASATTRRCSCRAASRSGCFERTRGAPRVLIANSNLVGRWATWEHFRELERKGLMMYGQMTAGSWIYIGSQGIVQGTYETFGAVARKHFGGSLRRAVRADGRTRWDGRRAAARGDDERRRVARRRSRRVAHRQAARDRLLRSQDARVSTRRLSWIDELATRAASALSVGLVGNAADVLPELVQRGVNVRTCSPTRRARTTC